MIPPGVRRIARQFLACRAEREARRPRLVQAVQRPQFVHGSVLETGVLVNLLYILYTL